MKEKLAYKAYIAMENAIWLEFLEQASPAEVLNAVATSNWDGNAFLLQWVKDNPQTDKACAMAIYWMNGPGWLKQFDSREHCEKEGGWELERYDVMMDVERKILDGFYQNSALAFDPQNFNDENWVVIYEKEGHNAKIPKALLKPIEGEVVEIDHYKYTEGLPHAFWDKVEAIFEKYDVQEEIYEC